MVRKTSPKPAFFGPISTIFLTIGTVFAAQFWAGVILSPLLIAGGANAGTVNGVLQGNPWLGFIFVATVDVLMLWTISQLLWSEFKASFKTLGLNRPIPKYAAYALAGFAAYFVLYIIVAMIAQELIPSLDVDQKQEIGFSTNTQGAALLPVFLSLIILTPIAEEVIARGFLFGGLRTKLPFASAAVATSILFAGAHLSGASDGLLWVGAIDTFILSLVLCYLREKSGSLWPGIGVHAFKNGIAFIILFNIVQYFR